jgi:ferritin-like metal-binding protein YciE
MRSTNGTEARGVFITGLKNAHAMEKQALSIMGPQLERIENYPDVLQRMRQHKLETEGQVRRLEAVLERMGESASGLKDTVMSAVGGLATLGHATAGDEILKNSFANFAFENYEIAAYNSLIALAEAAGEAEAVAPLRRTSKRRRRWPSGWRRILRTSRTSMSPCVKPVSRPSISDAGAGQGPPRHRIQYQALLPADDAFPARSVAMRGRDGIRRGVLEGNVRIT